jgi:1,4-alpha-glucan branching enzyme
MASQPRLGELDLYLVGTGRHEEIYAKLGAHVQEGGVAFAVWAPNAEAVSVIGDFNGWNAASHPLRSLGDSGIWEGFVEGAQPGQRY